jgi:hypothetical protein
MTTSDSSFIAQGPAAIGFYARGPLNRPASPSPLKFGAVAVAANTGVYGATDEVHPQPPALPAWGYAGVVGQSNKHPGVAGLSDTNVGVWGTSIDSVGVVGQSRYVFGVSGGSFTSWGVLGQSSLSSGVVGTTATSQGAILFPSTAGVFGIAGLEGPQVTQGPQVGKNIMPPTAGVAGTADQHPGVIGTSNAGIGVYGFSTGNAGVVGESTNSYAGYFAGNVFITGNLTLNGMKGAAVPFPDGTRRVLYCMESPELWFEDFGAGKLKRGRAVVKLDADFAKVIKRGDYHVFLTPRGDCRGLYVRRQGGLSFEVRELAAGTSSAAFSYRIVGRRKDIKGHRRFAKIDTRLPLPVSRARPARPARRAKMPSPTPAELRALAARMQKEAQALMRRRGRKGKGS